MIELFPTHIQRLILTNHKCLYEPTEFEFDGLIKAFVIRQNQALNMRGKEFDHVSSIHRPRIKNI